MPTRAEAAGVRPVSPSRTFVWQPQRDSNPCRHLESGVRTAPTRDERAARGLLRSACGASAAQWRAQIRRVGGSVFLVRSGFLQCCCVLSEEDLCPTAEKPTARSPSRLRSRFRHHAPSRAEPTCSAFPSVGLVPRYACFMARGQETRALAHDDLEELLEAAAADEREGHLHHCATEQELREFLQGLRREPS